MSSPRDLTPLVEKEISLIYNKTKIKFRQKEFLSAVRFVKEIARLRAKIRQLEQQLAKAQGLQPNWRTYGYNL